MITAAYTLCKNEKNKLDQWLHYTKDFDYRVILDTGSTDGTYELLKKVPNLILDQKTIDPFQFHILRNQNLDMIPAQVDWALSPDMDEYFSINVLSEMEKTIKQNPNVTNISCDRLDIYSEVVRVGPPKLCGTNKIHRRHDYTWVQPVYEHLWYKYHDIKKEVEIYNDDIYLIHDQDINKPRSTLYIKLMLEQFDREPQNCWNLWFLTNHYYREKDLENFVRYGLEFVKYHEHFDDKYKSIHEELVNIAKYSTIPENVKQEIMKVCNARIIA